MDQRPVIFLDFDGVLNSHDWWQRRPAREDYQGERMIAHARREIDPAAVVRLNRLIRETRAAVVISSTWRTGRKWRESCSDMLRYNGFRGTILGRTPELVTPRGNIFVAQRRGMEIQAWLDRASSSGFVPSSIVILDDDSDMCHLIHRLVKTDYAFGLLDSHVEQAKSLLLGKE